MVTCKAKEYVTCGIFIGASFLLTATEAANQGETNTTHARILNESKCGKAALRRCAAIADPILRDSRLAFPVDENELKMVCRSFSELIKCSKSFLENCLTGPSSANYLQALEDAAKGANDLCHSEANKKKEVYMEHAVCLRSIVSDNLKCAKPFNKLVTAVMSMDVENSEICWIQCDRVTPGASATAEGIIDSALNIVVSQCKSSTSNTECRVGRDETINNSLNVPPRRPIFEQPKQQELSSTGARGRISQILAKQLLLLFTFLYLTQ